ncbi:MAG: energy transducer TonB [Bacteroidales bacterium]|jgi:TonB family protein|nr:energy transducer TonB [Bacteroidales bacterium]
MKKLIAFLFFVTVALVHTVAQENSDDMMILPPVIDEPMIVDGEAIYQSPDVEAEYPGGIPALHTKYFIENLRYPSLAVEQGIQGIVIVEFIVKADGTIDNVKLVKGVHPSLDNEALRVVSMMPQWTPAKVNNENVSSYVQLPVQFKLAEKPKAETLQNNPKRKKR